MSEITQGIYQAMANDATLQTLLGEYYGVPAIFSTFPVPTDAPFPYIDMSYELTFSPFDTKVTQGVDLTREITVYTEADGSAALLETICDRVRALFHRQPQNVPIVGFDTVIVDMQEGPRFTTEDNRVQGKELELRLVLQRCPQP